MESLIVGMWKGGSTATSFPHRCPYRQDGVDKKTCEELSGQSFRQNKDGCCGTQRGPAEFPPCNSIARRCTVCLEMGRTGIKAQAVTNVTDGTCDEHKGGIAEEIPRKFRLPADPQKALSATRLEQKFAPVREATRLPVRLSAPVVIKPTLKPVAQPPPKSGPVSVREAAKPIQAAAQPNVPNTVRPDDDDESFPQQAAWEAMIARIKRAIANAVRVKVPPPQIRRMEGQPREVFDETELTGLEASIREVGQMQDGFIRSVTPDGDILYELLDGERRLICVTRAAIPLYNALLVEIDDEAAPYVVASILNFNRANHTDMEVSNAVKRLREGKFRVPFRIIAKMYGYKIQWTQQLYSLQRLDPRVKDLLDPRITKELIPVTGAIKLVRLEKYPEEQFQLALRLHNRQLPLTSLQMEVERILGEKNESVRTYANEPARRFKYIERRVQLMGRQATDVEVRLTQMRKDGLLTTKPPNADVYVSGLNDIIESAEKCIEMLGGKRRTETEGE